MIWGKTLAEKCERIYSVSKKFAWRPIQLENGRWVWWEYVWKHISKSCYSIRHHYERYVE